jgi:hypothetical protein
LNRAEIAVQPGKDEKPLWKILGCLFVQRAEARDWSDFGCLWRSFAESVFSKKPRDERLPVLGTNIVRVEIIKELVTSEEVNHEQVQISYPMTASSLAR